MTQIEVPSWVVEVAQKAYYEHDDTGSCQHAMLKAITAALGAWVERAGFMDEEAEFLLPRRDRCVLFSQTLLVREAHGARNLPLYTLRQEKPE